MGGGRGIYFCDVTNSRSYMGAPATFIFVMPPIAVYIWGELLLGVSRVASKRGNSSRFYISARAHAVARVVSDEMG
jgi:hypothetical protein